MLPISVSMARQLGLFGKPFVEGSQPKVGRPKKAAEEKVQKVAEEKVNQVAVKLEIEDCPLPPRRVDKGVVSREEFDALAKRLAKYEAVEDEIIDIEELELRKNEA